MATISQCNRLSSSDSRLQENSGLILKALSKCLTAITETICKMFNGLVELDLLDQRISAICNNLLELKSLVDKQRFKISSLEREIEVKNRIIRKLSTKIEVLEEDLEKLKHRQRLEVVFTPHDFTKEDFIKEWKLTNLCDFLDLPIKGSLFGYNSFDVQRITRKSKQIFVDKYIKDSLSLLFVGNFGNCTNCDKCPTKSQKQMVTFHQLDIFYHLNASKVDFFFNYYQDISEVTLYPRMGEHYLPVKYKLNI